MLEFRLQCCRLFFKLNIATIVRASFLPHLDIRSCLSSGISREIRAVSTSPYINNKFYIGCWLYIHKFLSLFVILYVELIQIFVVLIATISV